MSKRLYQGNCILKQLVQLKYNSIKSKYYELINIMWDIHFLKRCYFCIKSNYETHILSVNDKTLNIIDLKWFQKISNEIKNGTYTPKPIWILYIQTKKNEKQKYVIINSLKDKIIQKGFSNILWMIYEPIFSKYSYGLKRNKEVHNVIKHIKSWKDVSWFICLGIEKRFDTIHKKKLIHIMKQEIEDPKFLYVIYKFFNPKASVISSETSNLNVLFFILFNIYLNSLDKFIENLINLRYSSFKKIKYAWYINNCVSASFVFFFRYFSYKNEVMIFVFKHIFDMFYKNNNILSRNESQLKKFYVFKNSWQVTIYIYG